ncbi:RluA family pseudouridine synthase [Paenibacillus provencensis]|uniref:Pseudouridine synthase n=1 Tax=Paenibacillus provencensis TaxID=441151 RepID=A0ABW3PXT8_9BACL|nr:RluA family pseudouridine synthase [Paenibacillus sp. MER 78]MCM3127571.1 RluA family pseudouridine synthase [Paenibacillus sp. MER 78]
MRKKTNYQGTEDGYSNRPPSSSNTRSHKANKGHTSSFKRTAKSPSGKSASVKQTTLQAYIVQENSELLSYLLSILSNKSRNAVKALLSRGQISVDGKAVTAFNHPLTKGMRVTIDQEKKEEAPPLIGLTILHEDDDIIIVNKDSGLLSVASDKEQELTAYRQLMAHVRLSHPANRIFIVHRLDRDTSGVMMFAKSEEIQQALQNAWRDTVEERTYVALVEGKVKQDQGTITSYLKESKTLKMYSTPYANDGQKAITHYKTLLTGSDYSLLEIQLETGRKNQIRVHMEELGHPVSGDKKYGAKGRGIGRLALHARVLAFTHPGTGKPMRFETPIPKAFLRPFPSK